MSIIRCPRKQRFTCLDNRPINDPSLSWNALGIYTYIMSKPDNWRVSVPQLAKFRSLGRDGVYTALKNLAVSGYADKQPVRDSQGRITGMNWIFFDSPEDNPNYCPLEVLDPGEDLPADQPDTANPDTVLPDTAEPDTAEPDPANPTLLNTEKELITEKGIKTERMARTVSGETPLPSPDRSVTTDPVIITIPLNRGEYPVTQPQVEEWTALYPAVDVSQELRNIRGWALANPKKRKTAGGILRCINTWLSKEQDRGPRRQGQVHSLNRPPARRAQDDFAHKDYLGAATPDEQLPPWMREALHG